jgi:hypothetical protein
MAAAFRTSGVSRVQDCPLFLAFFMKACTQASLWLGLRVADVIDVDVDVLDVDVDVVDVDVIDVDVV